MPPEEISLRDFNQQRMWHQMLRETVAINVFGSKIRAPLFIASTITCFSGQSKDIRNYSPFTLTTYLPRVVSEPIALKRNWMSWLGRTTSRNWGPPRSC